MSATEIRFRGKAINAPDGTTPENGYVEGFYFQDLDNGIVKHYIHNCPMTWNVDPSTVRVVRHPDLNEYENPITTRAHVKELHHRLVQTTVDYIKENNLSDIWAVSFGVDGLENDAIKYGEWTPGMDSSLSVEGLQKENGKKYRIRKEIGYSM